MPDEENQGGAAVSSEGPDPAAFAKDLRAAVDKTTADFGKIHFPPGPQFAAIRDWAADVNTILEIFADVSDAIAAAVLTAPAEG